MISLAIEPFLGIVFHISIVTQLCIFTKEASPYGWGRGVPFFLALIGEQFDLSALLGHKATQKCVPLILGASLAFKVITGAHTSTVGSCRATAWAV